MILPVIDLFFIEQWETNYFSSIELQWQTCPQPSPLLQQNPPASSFGTGAESHMENYCVLTLPLQSKALNKNAHNLWFWKSSRFQWWVLPCPGQLVLQDLMQPDPGGWGHGEILPSKAAAAHFWVTCMESKEVLERCQLFTTLAATRFRVLLQITELLGLKKTFLKTLQPQTFAMGRAATH